MLVLGLILSVFGIGFFCWLIFTLIVYALPFFVGLTAGMAAFHGGAGVIGATCRRRRRWRAHLVRRADRIRLGPLPLILRAAIALLYAVPAAIAGYHAVLGLSQIGVPSLLWREAFAGSARCSSAGRHGRACRCLSRRFSGEAPVTVRLSRCRWPARPGTGEQASRRRSVRYRLDERSFA